MIWQLVRREPAWHMMPWLVVLFPAAAQGIFTPWLLLLLAIVVWTASEFALPGFTASLPIETRDLWIAQLASRLALLWLPVLAASARLGLGGAHFAYLLEGAAIWTVAATAARRDCGRQLVGFRSVWVASLGVVLCPLILVPYLISETTVDVSDICATGTVALALWWWFRSATQPWLPRFRWSPVFRTVLRGQAWAVLLLTSQVFMGSLAFVFIAVMAIMGAAQNARIFIACLPVPSQKLFRILTLPLAAAITAGSALRAAVRWARPLPPRSAVVELAMALAMLFILLFLFELNEWRRLSRAPRWLRVAPIACGLAATIPLFFRSVSYFDQSANRLAAGLPTSSPLFALALIVPVLVMYWPAERVFGELESPRSRATELA